MAPNQKRQASDDPQSGPESSKRVQRSENEGEKRGRPSFLKAKTIVKINVSDRVDDADESKRRKESFFVHKAFICQYSPFFDAAFNGSFEEGITQELDLPGTDPSAFSIFVDWLYTQRVTPIKLDDNKFNELTDLIKLWILADRLLIPRLQNEAIAAIHALHKVMLRSSLWSYIYHNTVDGSPLRRYLSRIISTKLGGTKSGPIPAKQFDLVPREMLVDLINDLRCPKNKAGSPMRCCDISEEELREFYVPEDHKGGKGEAQSLP